MKKLIALLLALAMVLALAACGGAPEAEAPAPEAEAPATEAPETVPPTVAVEDAQAGDDTIVKTDEISSDEKAAALGIPAAVKLRDTTALEGKKIGCSIVYKGDEWCAALAAALEALGEYYGCVDFVCEDGDINDETQTKQIENMVAAGVDMMMIDPTSPDGVGIALNKGVDAGIPIIIYDGYWSEGTEKAVTTVTWVQKDTGIISGEYFVNYVKENMDGKATVVFLQNMLSEHCRERFVGLNEIIDKANAEGCEITVLDTFDNQGNREVASNAISAIVQPYDFVISDVDNGAMGAVAALQMVGNTDVKVISMGAYGKEPFSKLYNEDPNYLACLNVDAWVLAQYIFDGAIDYFEGNEVPTQTNIALFMVDKSNVEEFWSDFE